LLCESDATDAATPPPYNGGSQITQDVKQLYCSCNNPQCGHGFVMNLAFSHTLSPSAVDMPPEALERIRGATRGEAEGYVSGFADGKGWVIKND
jgi:hypothetical protein